jgi:membrane protease YdiL (CAAX protease family)
MTGWVAVWVGMGLIYFPIWYALSSNAPSDLYQAYRRSFHTPWGLATGTLMMQAAAGMVVFWRARRDQSAPALVQLGLCRGRVGVWAWPFLFFASWPVSYAGAILTWLGQLMGLIPTKAPYFERDMRALAGAGPGEAVAIAVVLGLCAGFGEEIVVRGYLQHRLMRRWPAWAAIGAGSLLFAAFHLDLSHIVAIVPVGLWLGYVAWRTGSIRATIAVHACIDVTYFLLALLPRDMTEGFRDPWVLWPLGLLALVSFPASIAILEITARRRRAEVSVPGSE